MCKNNMTDVRFRGCPHLGYLLLAATSAVAGCGHQDRYVIEIISSNAGSGEPSRVQPQIPFSALTGKCKSVYAPASRTPSDGPALLQLSLLSLEDVRW